MLPFYPRIFRIETCPSYSGDSHTISIVASSVRSRRTIFDPGLIQNLVQIEFSVSTGGDFEAFFGFFSEFRRIYTPVLAIVM